MPQIPIGTTINPSGSTRTLDATTSGLKALSFRPGGAWPATNPGQYPLGTPALNTMKQFIEGYASGAWVSPLPAGTAPNGSDPGVYYPQLSTLPNNFEAEVYFNADAMTYIGGPPVITLDGNGDVVITPRLQTSAEETFVAKTAALANVPQIGKTLYTSGAFVAYPYSATAPFLAGARVKMPVPMAQGLWPAVWLLPASLQWPPEIDIIEYIETGGAIQLTTSLHDASLPNGSQTDVITGSINPQDGQAHDFWAQVYPDFITTFYDGKAVANFPTPADCSSLYWYLIVNYGIAGAGNGWPGPIAPGTSKFPPMTVVDVLGLNMPTTYGSGPTLSYIPPSGSSPITFSGSTPTPPPTTNFTASAPTAPVTQGSTFPVTGVAGTQWVNVVAFDAAGNKISPDVTPSASGSYTLQCSTSTLAIGSNALSVSAYSTPAGVSGGTSTTLNPSVTVAAAPPAGITMTAAQYAQIQADLTAGEASIASAQAILASLT